MTGFADVAVVVVNRSRCGGSGARISARMARLPAGWDSAGVVVCASGGLRYDIRGWRVFESRERPRVGSGVCPTFFQDNW